MGDALSSKSIHLGNKYNQCPELGIQIADGSKWCSDIFKLHNMQYADLVSDWKSPEWDLFQVEGHSLENCKNYQEYYEVVIFDVDPHETRGAKDFQIYIKNPKVTIDGKESNNLHPLMKIFNVQGDEMIVDGWVGGKVSILNCLFDDDFNFWLDKNVINNDEKFESTKAIFEAYSKMGVCCLKIMVATFERSQPKLPMAVSPTPSNPILGTSDALRILSIEAQGENVVEEGEVGVDDIGIDISDGLDSSPNKHWRDCKEEKITIGGETKQREKIYTYEFEYRGGPITIYNVTLCFSEKTSS